MMDTPENQSVKNEESEAKTSSLLSNWIITPARNSFQWVLRDRREDENIGRIRSFFRLLLNYNTRIGNPYEGGQRALTYGSLFLPATYALLANPYGGYDPEVLETMRTAFAVLFLSNLSIKTVDRGPSHIVTFEGVIDALSSSSTLVPGVEKVVGDPRAARLFRTFTKMTRSVGTGVTQTPSREDQAVQKIMGYTTAVGIAGLVLAPLAFDMRGTDYSNQGSNLREILVNSGIIGSIILLRKGVRRAIQSVYTNVFDKSERKLTEKLRGSPVQGLIQPYIDTADEIYSLVDALHAAIDSLKDTANPTGVPLRMSDGKVEPIEIPSGTACLMTDLRGSSRLTNQLGLKASSLMRNNYYPFLYRIIKKWGGNASSYGGDGLLALFIDKVDSDDGSIVLSAEDRLVLSTLEANRVTNEVALAIRDEYGEPDDELHYTGFGAYNGTIVVGDVLREDPTLDAEAQKMRENVSNRLRAENIECDLERQEHQIAKIRLQGVPANLSARMEAMNKHEDLKGRSCLVPQNVYENLAVPLQKALQFLGEYEVRDVGMINIYGVDRCNAIDADGLAVECEKWRQQATNRTQTKLPPDLISEGESR